MASVNLTHVLTADRTLTDQFLRANGLFPDRISLESDSGQIRVVAAAYRTLRRQGDDVQINELAHQIVDAYYLDPPHPTATLEAILKTRGMSPTSLSTMARQNIDPHLAFVQRYSGDENRIIRSVLIANNGMAAQRLVDAIREFARIELGNENAIRIVGMYTQEDRDTGFSYIDHLDEAIFLKNPPSGALMPYANPTFITDMAIRYGVDAVHPGWGWGAENPELARALASTGVLFMGPDADPMNLLGDKVRSQLLFQQVNGDDMLAPWSGSEVGRSLRRDESITDDHVHRSVVHNPDDAARVAAEVGYPVYLKAHGTGGGAGMRVAYTAEEAKQAFKDIRKEAPGNEILIMRMALQSHMVTRRTAQETAAKLGYSIIVRNADGTTQVVDNWEELQEVLEPLFARAETSSPDVEARVEILGGGYKHIEVQVIADIPISDGKGNVDHHVLAFWPRDCSAQSGNQKIVEETANIHPQIASKLMRAALRLTKAAGYSGAGTVEFLIDPRTGDYYLVDRLTGQIIFLEENTRVQVEHPVTEGTSDVDIIQSQFFISQGVRLNRIPQVQRYVKEAAERASMPDPGDAIDFGADYLFRAPKGHTIALRITRHNPDNKLQAGAGSVSHFEFDGARHVWGYSSVLGEGVEFGPTGDAQFAHLFIWGATRKEAIQRAQAALNKLVAVGDVKTNIPFLRALLANSQFTDAEHHRDFHNRTITQWIKEDRLPVDRPNPELTAVSSAFIQAAAAAWAKKDQFITEHGRGHIPKAETLDSLFPATVIIGNIKYEFTVHQTGPNTFLLINNHDSTFRVEGTVVRARDGSFVLRIGDNKFTLFVQEDKEDQHIWINGQYAQVAKVEKDPYKVKADGPGTVETVLVEKGHRVKIGDDLVEVMIAKKLQKIPARVAGTVEAVDVVVGSKLKKGQLLVSFVEDPAHPVALPQSFRGASTWFDSPIWGRDVVDPETSLALLQRVFDGYPHVVAAGSPEDDLGRHLDNYLTYRNSARAWGEDFHYFVSQYQHGMPSALFNELMGYANGLIAIDPSDGAPESVAHPDEYLTEVNRIVSEHNEALNDPQYAKANFSGALENYIAQEEVTNPQLAYARRVLADYANIEGTYATPSLGEPLARLRNNRSTIGPDRVYAIRRGHQSVGQKGFVLRRLMDHIGEDGKIRGGLRHELVTISRFTGPEYEQVSAGAKRLLLYSELGDPKARQVDLATRLDGGDTDFNKLLKEVRSLFAELVPLTFGTEEIRSDVDEDEGATNTRLRARRGKAIALYIARAYRLFSPEIQMITFDDEVTSVSFVSQYSSRPDQKYFGMVASVNSLDVLKKKMSQLLTDYAANRTGCLGYVESLAEGKNTLTLLVNFSDQTEGSPPRVIGEEGQSSVLRRFVQEHAETLYTQGIQRVTIGTTRGDLSYPSYFTYHVAPLADFRKKDSVSYRRMGSNEAAINALADEVETQGGFYVGYENQVYRNIEPPLATQLDFDLMQDFVLRHVPTLQREVHIFDGYNAKAKDRRFFVRSLVRDLGEVRDRYEGIDTMLDRSLDNLQVVLDRYGNGGQPVTWNEVFLNIVVPLNLDYQDVTTYLKNLIQEQRDRLTHLRVQYLSVRFIIQPSNDARAQFYRLKATYTPGADFDFRLFEEGRNRDGALTIRLPGQPDSTKVHKPYQPLDAIGRLRLKAQQAGTTYAYEWPDLFRRAVEEEWKGSGLLDRPNEVMTRQELYFNDSNELVEGVRPEGSNIVYKTVTTGGRSRREIDWDKTTGAVAFRLNLKTPEYPDGRDVLVAVINDVNVKGGSVGPRESDFYVAVARRAIQEGIPFIPIEANTGARFDLEKDVLKRVDFDLSVVDPSKPANDPDNIRINYLYLTQENYEAVRDSVQVEEMSVEGQTRYKITAIPGLTVGLDSDSLRGSGKIAGISDQAYQEIFTAALISGYVAVGIGSYFGRLLHRVVQNGPMVLTGNRVLNAILGYQAYLNNEQLGGYDDVMGPAGVAHWGAANDMAAVRQVVRLLGFVPKNNCSLPPVRPTLDKPDRQLVAVTPELLKDPDFLQREFFDQSSYIPSMDRFMDRYGGTVITGRGRLMGRAMGFIRMDPREEAGALKASFPADPAIKDHAASVDELTARVLNPESSYKIAEAIENFSHEGLGIWLLPDIKGFSGGTRDMRAEILKFGSMIVTQIRNAKVPIYIYFPPEGQLRGGAWVVFDKAINGEARVRMFADDTARGGVLEARGQIDLLGGKYREEVQAGLRRAFPEVDTMFRNKEAAEARGDSDQASVIEGQIGAYMKRMDPLLVRMLEEFADLQHKASAMLARGTTDEIVSWSNARGFFHKVYERDLELLDFEREIRRDYPTIKPRALQRFLDRYAEAIDEYHAKTGRSLPQNQWRDAKTRATIMVEVREAKDSKYGDEAFRANPSRYVERGLELYQAGIRWTRTREDPAVVAGFTALAASLAGAAHLHGISQRIELYQEVVQTMGPLGVFRSMDSDEDKPAFHDEQNNRYFIEISRQGELTVALVEGDIGGFAGVWQARIANGRRTLGSFDRIELVNRLGETPVRIQTIFLRATPDNIRDALNSDPAHPGRWGMPQPGTGYDDRTDVYRHQSRLVQFEVEADGESVVITHVNPGGSNNISVRFIRENILPTISHHFSTVQEVVFRRAGTSGPENVAVWRWNREQGRWVVDHDFPDPDSSSPSPRGASWHPQHGVRPEGAPTRAAEADATMVAAPGHVASNTDQPVRGIEQPSEPPVVIPSSVTMGPEGIVRGGFEMAADRGLPTMGGGLPIVDYGSFVDRFGNQPFTSTFGNAVPLVDPLSTIHHPPSTIDDSLVHTVQTLATEHGNHNLSTWFGDEDRAAAEISQVDLDNAVGDAFSALESDTARAQLRRMQSVLNEEEFLAVAVMVLGSRETIGHSWITPMADRVAPLNGVMAGGRPTQISEMTRMTALGGALQGNNNVVSLATYQVALRGGR